VRVADCNKKIKQDFCVKGTASGGSQCEDCVSLARGLAIGYTKQARASKG
jgi:hypothetical protein